MRLRSKIENFLTEHDLHARVKIGQSYCILRGPCEWAFTLAGALGLVIMGRYWWPWGRDFDSTYYVDSVTRLGNFLKFLATNFISKVAQIFHDFLGLFEKWNFSI